MSDLGHHDQGEFSPGGLSLSYFGIITQPESQHESTVQSLELILNQQPEKLLLGRRLLAHECLEKGARLSVDAHLFLPRSRQRENSVRATSVS